MNHVSDFPLNNLVSVLLASPYFLGRIFFNTVLYDDLGDREHFFARSLRA